MIHIIYITFIAVILGLYLRDYFEVRHRVQDANAREQGLDEIEEGYQAEIMTLDDKIESLKERMHNVYEAHRLIKEEKETDKIQYEATISDLKEEVVAVRDAYEACKVELDDVRQRGLEMQIDLTVSDRKTTEQIYRETQEAMDAFPKPNNA